jgi:hypothetical protein
VAWLGLLGLVVVASLVLFTATSAHAAYTTGTPLSVGAGKLATSVAVNQTSKDVYVASGGSTTNLTGAAGEVKRFPFGGGEQTCASYPEHPFGIAVNSTTGKVTIVDGGTTKAIRTFEPECGVVSSSFNLSGAAGLGTNPLPQPAIDSVGRIDYPKNVLAGKVEVFEPNGTAVGTAITGLVRPNVVTLDSAGNRYVVEPRGCCTNEVQNITFSGSPTGGSFSLSFAGETKAITYAPATLESDIRAGLESLPIVGIKNVFVNPGPNVEFKGSLQNTDLPEMTCDGSGLTGGTSPSCSVSTSTGGGAGTNGHLYKYAPTGDNTLLETFYTGDITTAAVDAATGNVFIGSGYGGSAYPGKGFHIEKYSAAGVKLADFGDGSFTSAEFQKEVLNQLAVNQSDGTVYAADGGAEKVRVFKSEVRPKFLLKVEKTGSGAASGTVTSDISGINCGTGPACEHEYEEQEFVTLTEQPGGSSNFVKWENCPEVFGSAGEKCRVKITAAKTVKAEFVSTGFSLGITNIGTGTGTVECEVNAGPAEPCALSYPNGTTIKLKTTASAGSEFKEFSEDCTGSTCELTMTANKSVKVKFDLIARTLTINKLGTGTGTVECKVGAGSFGACAASYPDGTSLTLQATANAGSEFKGFSGTGSASSCSTSPCSFTIIADTSVDATFDLIPRTLTINKLGTGTGTVECKVGAGSFGACAASYPNGTALTLQATANAGSEFKGFSNGTGSAGGCTTSPCSFTIEANTSVDATFDLIARTLTITKNGTGTGTVECKVGAGSFGACAASYPNGTSLTLQATPNAGSEFSGFSAGTGSASSCTTSPCSFTISANSSLTATFTLIARTLTINKPGTGTGTVECKVGAGSFGACAASYPNGTSLTLQATANAGSEFKGFSNGTGSAGSCTTSPCSFTIEANTSVDATFDLIARTLTINKPGTGTGTVECKVGAGSFGACAASYPNGTALTLQATANAGSEFNGFSNGTGSAGSCSTSPCSFTISANTSVDATFDLIPGNFKLTVTKSGTGTGTVTSSPPGINCGGDCEETYTENTVVTLTPSADPGSEFKEWTGACSGSSTCEVTMSAAKSVDAKFDLIQRTLTITKNGTGTGTVECKVGAGSFGACAASYPDGTSLTLQATANAGSEFTGFSAGTGSAASCTTSPCSFTISANSSVTATFNLAQRTLTITKNGTGTGTVECKVGAGSFGACAASYPDGTSLTLQATANAGSEFTGFSAGTGSAASCTTSPCSFTISANSSVTATFNLIQRTLTITKNGTGTGTVECKVGAGSFGACAASYPDGTSLTLQATANAGSEFSGFSAGTGSASSCSTSPCSFTISANSSLTATFTATAKTLTITKNGTGTGTVECKVGAGSFGACAASYPDGTSLTLQATANAGSEFSGFSNGTGSAGSCSTSPCSFTISANSALTATFTLIPRTLTITKNGTGTGTVECKVGAGSFGACAASYPDGTSLTLQATANAGSEFSGFSAGTGSASSCTTSPCSFTISANSSLTATFSLIPRTLTITKNGTGTGTVECKVGAGSFGACAASYPDGTSLTLQATANAGSAFSGFSAGTGSASSCTTSPCSFTISANSALTATFTLIPRTLTITKNGTGTGTVECKVGAGSFGACAASYADGTALTLQATANAGSAFSGFSAGTGSASSCTTSPCSFTISANSALTATFTLAQRTLTINKAGTGDGSFACDSGFGYGSCQASYPDGTTLVVKATPDSHSTFTSWTGCSSQPEPGKCAISSINANTTLTATFTAITRTLTVNKAGSGSGSVACDGGACSASYKDGTKVTLTASAGSGSTFAGWSGGGCSGTGSCSVTMDANKTVTATFDAEKSTTAPQSPPPPPGEAKPENAAAPVTGGKAAITLSCDSGVCSGTLKLIAKLKQGKKLKDVEIGSASYDLKAGESKTVKVTLSATANKILKEGKTLKATLSGSGVSGTVKLKLAAPKKKHHKK